MNGLIEPPSYWYANPEAPCENCHRSLEDHGCGSTKAKPCVEADENGDCDIEHCPVGEGVFAEEEYDDFGFDREPY